MFKNIGFKIMKMAEFFCWIGIIFSVSAGLATILLKPILEIQSNLFIVYGILLIIFGPILSWVNSFVLYGFGRLIENSDIIAGRKNKN